MRFLTSIALQLMARILCLVLLLGVVVGLRGNALVFTQVTCIYDIGRGSLKTQGRSYQHYLSSFAKLLETSSNMIIFGDQLTQNFVWNRRQPHNTVFVRKEMEDLKSQWFYAHIARINAKYQKESSKNFIQFRINEYNTIMFSKYSLMKEALKYDKFQTDMIMWIDAGLFSHVIPEQFSSYKQPFIQKIFQFTLPQWVFFTPLPGNNIDVFRNISKFISKEPGNKTSGGFQGGFTQTVKDMTNTFQNFLRVTLENDEMDSDQIIYEMMPVKFPYLIPVTSSKPYKQVYKRYNVYPTVSRKPQIVRQFKGIFKEYKLMVFEDAIYEANKPKNDYFINLIQQVQQLSKENALYGHIFYRLSFLLALLVIVYGLLRYKNSFNEENHQYRKI